MKFSFPRGIHRFLSPGIALGALIILNGVTWWIHQVSLREIRSNLVNNLQSTAALLAHQVEVAYQKEIERRVAALDQLDSSTGTLQVGGSPVENLVPSFDEWLSESADKLLVDLVSSRESGSLIQDVYLLDRRGALLASLNGDLLPNPKQEASSSSWNIHPLLSEDSGFIRESLQVHQVLTTDDDFEGGYYFLTSYAPISDLEGLSGGLVGLRAPLLFGERLTTARRRLLFADLVGSVLILLLAMMFHRLSMRLERNERILQQQEHLAQIGQMAAVVAHEVRNPLGVIEQTAEVLRRRYDPQRQDELLRSIPEEVDRLNRLVSRFLTLARPELGDRSEEESTCELSAVACKVCAQLDSQAAQKGIRFDIQTGEIPKRVVLSPDAAYQVLLNLLLNALEASPPGSLVTVVLEEDAQTCSLCVKDLGCGMDEETLAKATQPFFTTRQQGSGLGLTLVQKFIHEAGGSMRIQSQKGVGTEITITLKKA